MIDNCLAHAESARQQGKHIVGIMCEFTPREIIMAADALPVCLCGGSAETIPAAERHLPANLCPLIKSTFGYHIEQANPFLEMADLIVAETTCDGKKKMFELMGQSRPMYVLELPQKVDDSDALEHWTRELRKLSAHLSDRFSVEITDSGLRRAIEIMNRERSVRRALAGLMKSDSPPFTGRELLDAKSIISGIPEDLDAYAQAVEMLPIARPDPDLASRIRVLLTGVPNVHGAEKVVDIIEDNGGLVVCMENCTGLKPILEDVDLSRGDPLTALAGKYFHLPCSVMTTNERRLDSLRELVKEYRPQCVVDLVWQACLTYDVESARIRRLVQDEFALPYLRIETDYSPSDTAAIAVRLEAMFEMARGGVG
jgi:benzoyl-CoA reductase/2-hydroxyglutaryl-CoA dehydratase subunit BcrC/BadD/HgdB